MDLGIKNKKALVLASSQGLGLGIATRLCREGANVLLTGRVEDKLTAAAAALNDAGPGSASFAVVDLTDADAATKLVTAAEENLGRVDILVNNTGGPPPGSVDSPDMESWRAQFDVMVMRIIELTNLCLPGMKEAGWGRVLTVASSGVVQPIPNLSMSNTIRSALVGWSKSLSNEVAADGITANILLPGRIRTERLAQIDRANAKKTGRTVEEVAAAEQAMIPAGRYGTVEDFGNVGAFLCSEAAAYMTGGLVRCDGGSIRSV